MARKIKLAKPVRGVRRSEDKRQGSKVMWVLKSLLAAYVVTGFFLIVLAFLLYKLELDEKVVSAAITGIYLISTLIGGLIIGKLVKTQRFLWGLGIGALYFALLLAITLGVYHTLNGDGGQLLTTFLLCMGGGTAGGMLS